MSPCAAGAWERISVRGHRRLGTQGCAINKCEQPCVNKASKGQLLAGWEGVRGGAVCEALVELMEDEPAEQGETVSS